MEIPAKINDPEVIEIVEGLLSLSVEREKEIAELTFKLESLKKKVKELEGGTCNRKTNNPHAGRKDVMIADGADVQRQRLASILTSGGYEVVGCAKDGHEAVKLFHEKTPALVTVDAHLSGIDSCQTILRMKEADPDVHIIMLSRNRDRQKVIEAINVGAGDYICKPVEDGRYLEAVEKLLASNG